MAVERETVSENRNRRECFGAFDDVIYLSWFFWNPSDVISIL